MKKAILFILLATGTTYVNAQLKVASINYKVLASAQKDSVLMELGDSAIVKEPNYMGGATLLQKKLEELLKFQDWKKKKAGVYTAYVTRNWDEISVISTSKKAKDLDLVSIAAGLKHTAPRWSSYTVGDQSMSRYTFQIDIKLEKD